MKMRLRLSRSLIPPAGAFGGDDAARDRLLSHLDGIDPPLVVGDLDVDLPALVIRAEEQLADGRFALCDARFGRLESRGQPSASAERAAG